MEGVSLAVEQMLGQQSHEGHPSLVPEVSHSLPGPQDGQLHPHCCAVQTALQQPGMTLLHLQVVTDP